MTTTVLMTQAACKCLSLWNGSTNVAPPANWDQVSFNDSGWASSAAPSGSPSGTREYQGGQNIWVPANGRAVSLGAERVWRTSSPANNAEEILIRWRFTLDSGPFTNYIVWVEDSGGSGGGLSSGTANVNGTFTVNLLNALSWSFVGSSAFISSGQNLIAIWVNSGNTGAAATWGPNAWITMAVQFPDDVGAAALRSQNFAALIG